MNNVITKKESFIFSEKNIIEDESLTFNSSSFLKKSNDDLLPIFNPEWNKREICGNILLLEDHLLDNNKFCSDCCKKHMLTMEYLANEMRQLDIKGEYKEYYDLPQRIRNIAKKFLEGTQRQKIAQEFRALRKELLDDKCFAMGIITK